MGEEMSEHGGGLRPERTLRQRVWKWGGLFMAGLLLALLLDSPLYHWLRTQEIFRDGSQLFKNFGYLPLWLIAALALFLHDLPLQGLKGWRAVCGRAGFLAGSALFSGLLAEILKLIIRRERPQGTLFTESVFRGWSGAWWKSNDFGTPSSHAAVAFGAAWALWFIFPRARLVWLLAATGCGVSRIVHEAHLPSDIYLAAGLALGIALWLRPRFILNNGGFMLPPTPPAGV